MKPNSPGSSAQPKQGGLLQAMKAIAWGFFGVRKSSNHQADVANLSLKQVVIAGILGGAIFVGTLIAIVSIVTA